MSEEPRCAECNAVLAPGEDREQTANGTFCRRCYDGLAGQLRQVVAAQGSAINYVNATAGGLLGAVVGIFAWWGFTILTKIAFGLVAVVIGFTVGQGVVRLSGGKRSAGLQALSATIAALAFVYASYLVDRSFIQQALAERGDTLVLPLVPAPTLLFQILSGGFGVMDLVFLAIVVWQAWKIPQPLRLSA